MSDGARLERLSLVKDYAGFPLQGILPFSLTCQGGAKKQKTLQVIVLFAFVSYITP